MTDEEIDLAEMAYEESEGAAEWGDVDDLEGIDELDLDMLDSEEDWDDIDSLDDEDDYDADLESDYDEEFELLDEDDLYLEDGDFESDEEEAIEEAVIAALDAEDADEFFSKLRRLAKRVARGVKKGARFVGKAGRFAAPILSKIPHPYAQAAAKVARVAGMLRAEGATEEEALEVFSEMAKRDRRALPVVAGLAARVVAKGKTANMSRSTRRRMVKSMKSAAKTITRRHGKKATPAIAKVVKSVKRNTAARPVPTAAKVKMVKRAAAKVSRSPILVRKLSVSPVRVKRAVKKAGVASVRTYRVPGPSVITVRPA